MKSESIPGRIWVRGSFEVLNTSHPTALMGYSCQALEKEPQRQEYVAAKAVKPCIDYLREITEWCEHSGDDDGCRACELVAAFDEATGQDNE